MLKVKQMEAKRDQLREEWARQERQAASWQVVMGFILPQGIDNLEAI